MLIHCSQHTAPQMNVYFYIYDSWQILEGWLTIYFPEEHYEPYLKLLTSGLRLKCTIIKTK